MFSLLLSSILLEPLSKSANEICTDPEDPLLFRARMSMPSVEFTNPSEISQFKKIEENLQNPETTSWIYCDLQWVKILATKNFNNISQLGLAFEANVDALDPDLFEIFHICRLSHCRFVGTTLEKGAKFRHVAAVSFRLSSKEIQPVSDGAVTPSQPSFKDPEPSPRSVIVATRLLYASLLVTGLGLIIKINNITRDLDLGALLEHQMEAGITTFLDNAFDVLVRVETL